MTHSDSRRTFLQEATKNYHQQLSGSPGEAYLHSRGLPLQQIERFRLGYVAEPLAGHEQYRGCLAIPYIRKSAGGNWAVIEMKFRHINPPPGVDKYLNVTGSTTRIFNTIDMVLHEQTIAICEGEMDAIAASSNGIPAVGIAGVTNWKSHYDQLFYGFDTVYILADGDEAGKHFSNTLAEKLDNAKVVVLPPGEDVNSVISSQGADWLKEKLV